MSTTPTLRIRLYSHAFMCAILCAAFLVWVIESRAGWPFFNSESATPNQIWIARVPAIFYMVCFGYTTYSTFLFRIDADRSGIYYRKDFLHEPVTTRWEDVQNWCFLGSDPTATDSDGKKIYLQGRGWSNLHFQLNDGKEWYLTLGPFGEHKTEQLITLLRTYIGDREFPKATIRR